jgi:hypothetical protein
MPIRTGSPVAGCTAPRTWSVLDTAPDVWVDAGADVDGAADADVGLVVVLVLLLQALPARISATPTVAQHVARVRIGPPWACCLERRAYLPLVFEVNS